jgi:hypothetical protein
VINAVIIIMSRGIAAGLLNNPRRIKMLQPISKTPVNEAQNSG